MRAPATPSPAPRSDYLATTAHFVSVKITGSSAGFAAFTACRVYNEAQPMKVPSAHRPCGASSEQEGDDFVITFPSVAGRHYTVNFSNSLNVGTWQPVLTDGTPATNLAGTGGLLQVTDTGGALQSRRFYQITIPP
jgi:hypothetical protein